MNKKKWIYMAAGGAITLLISLSAAMWCPWINEAVAQEKAISHFNKTWENSADGCSLNCEECGVVSVKKVSFGQTVTLQSICGWAGDVISLETNDIFINFLGNSEIQKEGRSSFPEADLPSF